jgi:hypothetical protein
MGDILCKIHKSNTRWILALCDFDIYGKKFVEGKLQLDLTTQFYKGETLNEEQVREEIKKCLAEDASFNIVGEEATQIAKDMELITEEGITYIQEIPIALILL